MARSKSLKSAVKKAEISRLIRRRQELIGRHVRLKEVSDCEAELADQLAAWFTLQFFELCERGYSPISLHRRAVFLRDRSSEFDGRVLRTGDYRLYEVAKDAITRAIGAIDDLPLPYETRIEEDTDGLPVVAETHVRLCSLRDSEDAESYEDA